MSTALGPYVQMVKLAQHMASAYQADGNLDLEPLVSHYVEEVEVNVRSDAFDHQGFIDRIRDALSVESLQAGDCRRGTYLRAVVRELDACAAASDGPFR
ncbi:hypothetical protein ASG25_03205 [Rhizobium sp. Leaf384]|uniref:hypothetical protein n=1 Tax=unclassified Rhizobium TaxID=2613769 RepID=UPI0007162C44|nr:MULTISPECIES: hypothetical protein [unclassified Rhizobium]KQR70836.1 hypothetical protein ASG03_04450 [Rhizobium sp. Leaf341]KQS80596.1 hypothetical protein ASG25_03205 [Rhizobium sp. Leaf384]KQS82534.1 hypothetical protein ASG58_04020 [Rhizobium sp. Leaf383]